MSHCSSRLLYICSDLQQALSYTSQCTAHDLVEIIAGDPAVMAALPEEIATKVRDLKARH